MCQTQEYDEELRSERKLRRRALHAARRRTRAGEGRVRRGAGASDRGRRTPMERDVEVRARAKEMKRLDVADNGLCFGRLDAVSGERSYVGRIGLFDEDNEYEPVLLDWRAPAARAFYVATGATPRACAGAASSTPAGAGWSTSPTRCSAVPPAASAGTRRCSPRSTRRAARACATSSRRSRPSRTRSSGSTTRACW